MDLLPRLACDRIGCDQIAFIAVGILECSAVPTCGLAVFCGVNRDLLAIAQGRDIDEIGLGAVGGWEVIVAAGMAGADLLGWLRRILIGESRIDLDVLGGIIVDRLAGFLVDAFGPVGLHIGLGADHGAVRTLHGVEEAVAAGM